MNEVYQKLNKTAVKSQQQAVVSLETIRSCVLEMWENHLPYDNVDHVINALNKLKEISGAGILFVNIRRVQYNILYPFRVTGSFS